MTSTIRAARQRLRWADRQGVGRLDILLMDRKGTPRRGGPILRSSRQLQAHIRMVGRREPEEVDDLDG